MSEKTHREFAKDRIIAAIIAEAVRCREAGQTQVAEEIKKLGSRLAMRYGMASVTGLPDTFGPSQRGQRVGDAALADVRMKIERA